MLFQKENRIFYAREIFHCHANYETSKNVLNINFAYYNIIDVYLLYHNDVVSSRLYYVRFAVKKTACK